MYYARVDINLMVENIIQIQIGITINADASAKIRKKKHRVCKEDYIWNPSTYTCKK